MNIPVRLATLFFSISLVACDSPVPVEPQSGKVDPAQALNEYADSLVAANSSQLIGYEPAIQTMNAPLSYVLEFHTSNPSMLTKDIAENDQSGYESNLAITNRWQSMYCTEKLKQVMEEHRIFSAGAHIVDTSGNRHSLAVCTG